MLDSTNPSTLARTGGPIALASGSLMTVAQLVMWPFDNQDHVATTQSVVFQVAGAVYFVAFCLLMLALVSAYSWEALEAGRLGVVGVVGAVVGTMALGGDLWFESFAVPWIADKVPEAFDAEPTVVLALGAISSYLLFAIGFGIPLGLAVAWLGVWMIMHPIASGRRDGEAGGSDRDTAVRGLA